MSPLRAALRVLSRGGSSQTVASIPQSTPLEVAMRSYPVSTVPSRAWDGDFWKGEVEHFPLNIWSHSSERQVAASLAQVRNLYSPFSGPMTLECNGEVISIAELTRRLPIGKPIDLVLISETETKSDETILNEVLQGRREFQERPSIDQLIEWVAANHELEGSVTRAVDIREFRRSPDAALAVPMPQRERADLSSCVSMVEFLERMDWNTDITLDWLESAHFELDEQDSNPGIIRSKLAHQRVAIRALQQAGFNFPEGPDLDAGLAKFISEVRDIHAATQDVLIPAHNAHQQFVSLHPFMDGNGRLGRLVWMVLLHRCGYPPAMFPRGGRHILMQALYQTQIRDDWALFYRISNEAVWRALYDPTSSSMFFDNHV